MKKHNTNNVRVIRNYCVFLKEAKRQSDASVDGVTKAINRFECTQNIKTSNSFTTNKRLALRSIL